MIGLIFTVAAGLPLVYIFFLRRNVRKVAGVYSVPRPDHFIRKSLIQIYLYFCSWRKDNPIDLGESVETENFTFRDHTERDPAQGTLYLSAESACNVEKFQNATDRLYFAGTDINGYKIVCSLACRTGRQAELWLFIDIPGFGCLQHPYHPDVDIHHTSGANFSAGGLTFEVVEPMKTWRVSFSGKLRRGPHNTLKNKSAEFFETSFSFLWNTFSQPFNVAQDQSLILQADNIARETWSSTFFKKLKLHLLNRGQLHYQQWGELRGRLHVEGQKEQQLYLQCVRDRFSGKLDWSLYQRYLTHNIYLETGMCIQIGVFSEPGFLSHAKVGYLSYPNGDLVPVTEVNLNLWSVGDDSYEPPATWSFSFVADGKNYEVIAKPAGPVPVWFTGPNRCGRVVEAFTRFTVNSVAGRGVTEFFYKNVTEQKVENIPKVVDLVQEASEDLVRSRSREITLPFTDLACTSSALVGGKGAQLAQLTQIEKHMNAMVPPGFCLTLQSFELQLRANDSIIDAIKKVEEAALSKPSILAGVCEEAVGEIMSADICEEVQVAILEALDLVRPGEDFRQMHFAVRSSAAGEDGAEASSAGQMETILGVVGFSKILTAVRQCWASVYSHQAVEYRRQHGQPIHVLVGVVIQKMVPAQAAGVMFTADPVSGSTSVVVVNANFGLGESVVSGSSDPDTIRVNRDPDTPHDVARLKLGSTRIGEKKTMIVETADGGIKEENVSEESSSVCLTEAMILKLATLGIELEKRYGSARDIEWAVVGTDIFMLQCRPITVADAETEYDLLHEFDSPMTCDFQWLTTSNISEMIPGAITPLTLSTFSTCIESGLNTLLHHIGMRKRPTHLSKCLPSICNHLFISLIDVGSPVSFAMLARKDVMELSLLGKLLPEMTKEQMESYGGRADGLRRVINFVNMMRMWSKASGICSHWEKRIPSYKVGEKATCAAELYDSINTQLKDYETVWVWTLINSGRSGNMATVLMSIIAGDASEWTTEHYGDIALLLSQCNGVYSAEVPHAIEKIARAIAGEGEHLAETFQSTPDEDCMELLSQHPTILGMVQSFLERHGHRCLRESEMREQSWRSAPQKFFSVVKLLLKTKAFEKDERQSLSVSELMANLKTPLPFHKKQILKLLLPKAWQAVGAREWGKSLSIQMHEVFKLAYGRLARYLQHEGRLPDADLMYFLTHYEIGVLIKTSSARLVIKAQKRRKILARQAELKFEQISKSRPVPIDPLSGDSELSGVECLNGMPVSQGKITGPAQVVHSLEGAGVIKAGDILVVKSTDVGWSPYFPLIGGLVTELGGLISHGAVVAREYGIPCVVNVTKATSIIKSGEILELDGRAGTIKRLDVRTGDCNSEA